MAIQYNFLKPIDQKVRDQGYDFVSQDEYLQDLRSSAKMFKIYIFYVIFRISCFTCFICFVHLRDECSNEQSSLVLNHFEKGRVGRLVEAHRGATAKIAKRSTQKLWYHCSFCCLLSE